MIVIGLIALWKFLPPRRPYPTVFLPLAVLDARRRLERRRRIGTRLR